MSNTRAPVIGSYRREASEEVKKTAPAAPQPSSALSEGIQEDLKDTLDKNKAGAEKAKTYEEILAENNITREKAHLVVDALLEKGYYEETYQIKLPTSSTVTVTLRTRTQADYIRFLHALEANAPRYVEEQRELQARYYLVASLISFRGQTFPGDTTEKTAFESKMDWLEKQPERIVALLTNRLAAFDREINIIMNEGAVENF